MVETVSDVLGGEYHELPPLSESIDLDVLEAAVTTDSPPDVTVLFTDAGLHVTVSSTETVYARPIEPGSDVSVETTRIEG
ncbi:HalOD1 output domain-containing protein [Halosimplex salinum]|uniref:HalOD1 output domain-containing protein n=1 Tax=Halosimplex salinum TaxID=1710538 RepID=UPI0013DDFDAA|nr:HalOD1 output domain-containing protein [Halosimplex salinum]